MPHEETVVDTRAVQTSLVVNLAAATQGHTLIASVTVDTTALTPTISGSGWARVVNFASGVAARIQVWWKVAGASEPTAITFTHGGTATASGFVTRLSGMHATSPYVNDSDGAGGSDATAEVGTAGGSGSGVLIGCVSTLAEAIAVSNYSGYTAIGELSEDGASIFVFMKTSTASDSPTITLDTAVEWIGFLAGLDAAEEALYRRRREEA